MVRVKREAHPIAGIANLSELNDTRIDEFIDRAFETPSLHEGSRKENSSTREYGIIWNSLGSRAKIENFDNEIVDRLIRDPEETVLVGIDDAHYASNYGGRLGRKMKTAKYKESGIKLSIRHVAEKDVTSVDDAGSLIAVRRAK